MKILILFVSLLFAQGDEGATIRDIGTALNAGSSKELIKFCNKTVEVKINSESSNYSKAQAEVVLKDFFTENPPQSFSYIHQGSSPEGLKYTIGRYSYEGGAFRVVMFIKKIDDNYLIDTLNFSEE